MISFLLKGLHSSRLTYRFRVSAFDFLFQWIVGLGVHGASTIGECFYAASEIKDGNVESWIRAWLSLGQRVQRRADAAFAAGHRISAYDCYLRAYTYWRAPLIFIDPRSDQRFQTYLAGARANFRKAIEFAAHAIEPVEIRSGAAIMPGYFVKASRTSEKRKTLIVIGGLDTFVEDLYLYAGPAACARGYNVLVVDLPGQGDLPMAGSVWPVEAETPFASLIDYLHTRSDVDTRRIAAFGISAGGYLVPRAACFERRLCALVSLSLISDFAALWSSVAHLQYIAKIETSAVSPLLKVARSVKSGEIPVALRLLDIYKWRWGVETISDLYKRSAAMTFDPVKISCPTLLLISQHEYEEFEISRRMQERALEAVQSPLKRLTVIPTDEGGDGHACGTNIPLANQLVFDWLDEVLA